MLIKKFNNSIQIFRISKFMVKAILLFKGPGDIAHFNSHLQRFDVNLIRDNCFRLLFTESLTKISQRLMIAQLSWNGPKKISFKPTEVATLCNVFELTQEELFSDPFNLQLFLSIASINTNMLIK
jgi:hypothetical protein